jgi:hypothetical protein
MNGVSCFYGVAFASVVLHVVSDRSVGTMRSWAAPWAGQVVYIPSRAQVWPHPLILSSPWPKVWIWQTSAPQVPGPVLVYYGGKLCCVLTEFRQRPNTCVSHSYSYREIDVWPCVYLCYCFVQFEALRDGLCCFWQAQKLESVPDNKGQHARTRARTTDAALYLLHIGLR